MMIEIGEYIRTNKGNIGKLINKRMGMNRDTNDFMNIYMLDNGLWTVKEYIVKHSKNIINLIEVGDYVNGKEIIDLNNFDDKEKLFFMIATDGSLIYENEVKTILTKEQYEQNCYKVEEE